LLGASCHWLGVRLERMPWVQAMREMPLLELETLAASIGVNSRVTGARHLVSKILMLASKDPVAKGKLVHELAATASASAFVEAKFGENLRECPEAVRRELDVRAHARSEEDVSSDVGVSIADASLHVRLAGALADVGGQAALAMVRKYVPEMVSPHGSPSALARRLVSVLRSAAPPAAAPELSSASGVDLIGVACHWLEIRLRQMPWVGMLNQMPLNELKALAARWGAAACVQRRRVVARILASASRDRHRAETLRGMSPPVDTTEVGYIDECPASVQAAASRLVAGLVAR